MTANSEVFSIVQSVLDAWGIGRTFANRFLCADGLAVAALLCNAAAKFVDYEFYDFKPLLIEAAAEAHNHVWQEDGVVYFETCVGQLSFHVFDGEDELLPSANGRQWAGGWMQDNARLIAEAFLSGGDDGRLEYIFNSWLDQEQGGNNVEFVPLY